MGELKIGATIARLRKLRGLTQSDLAEELFVSDKAVSKWERGVGYPDITQLQVLAKTLGTTVDGLLAGERTGITVAGNIIKDTVKIVNVYPEKGMMGIIDSLSQAVGGCVPNTGIDLAKLDKKLKVDAIGRVGNDESGRFILSEMQKYGVDVSKVITDQKACTSFCDVMTIESTGERTFFSHEGANGEFCPQDIDVEALNCEMFHIGYLLLMRQFDAPDEEYGTALARLLKHVQEAGIRTSFDVVSNTTGKFSATVLPALKYTDNAFMNEVEASEVSGIPPRDENGNLLVENVRKTMEIMMKEGVGERLIVHAPEAGFCYAADGTFTVVPSLDLPKDYIKGSVGAGDAYCAGCLYGIYKGMSDKEMLEFASACAAMNLAAKDSISSMKDKESVYALMKKYGRKNINY
ncbi:MAG: helix-turn-helix domain-containing protein [Clostridia bacterium]|nr:helix-turn-helix domain-containing protein [Clostridia bacterium]